MNPNDSQLDDLLKKARVPDRSEGYWERFPGRVTARLEQPVAETPGRGWRSHAWIWGLTVATTCFVLAFGTWLHHRSNAEADLQLMAYQAKLYRGIVSLFPNRVRAIVSDATGVHLVLSDSANVPSSTPILVRVCQANQCRDVITFSGQQVKINGENCDVLMTAENQILVVGRRTMWSSEEPVRSTGRFRIEVHVLGAS